MVPGISANNQSILMQMKLSIGRLSDLVDVLFFHIHVHEAYVFLVENYPMHMVFRAYFTARVTDLLPNATPAAFRM